MVGFLGDEVNDAVARHDAGSGSQSKPSQRPAKDAADIVLAKRISTPCRRHGRGPADVREHDQVGADGGLLERPGGRQLRAFETAYYPPCSYGLFPLVLVEREVQAGQRGLVLRDPAML